MQTEIGEDVKAMKCICICKAKKKKKIKFEQYTLVEIMSWWPQSPSHAHLIAAATAAAAQSKSHSNSEEEQLESLTSNTECVGWRSPIKPESKAAIASLPLPPLEAMLAAIGDAHIVRQVCRRVSHIAFLHCI